MMCIQPLIYTYSTLVSWPKHPPERHPRSVHATRTPQHAARFRRRLAAEVFPVVYCLKPEYSPDPSRGVNPEYETDFDNV